MKLDIYSILAILLAVFLIVKEFKKPNNVDSYKRYLNTKHWKKTRKKALARSGNKCAICSSKENLQVHHNNYSNLYNEKDTDLIVLCDKHHAMVHNK